MEESNKHRYQEAKVIELPVKRQESGYDPFIDDIADHTMIERQLGHLTLLRLVPPEPPDLLA